MERREYTRVTVALAAELRWPDGRAAHGTVRDISFGGAYLEAPVPPAAVESELPVRACRLLLRLGSVALPLQCDLVDLAGTRLGLRFTRAERADFERLRTYLLSVAPDPDALRRQLEDSPNPAFSPLPQLPGVSRWLGRVLARLRGGRA